MCQGPISEAPVSGWTFSDLNPGERALLGALRGWAAGSRGHYAPGLGSLGIVHHAVKGAGLPVAAVLPLAALLAVIDIAGTGNGPILRCVSCRNVGADEALLLDAVAAAQWRLSHEVHAIMTTWFPPGACVDAAVGPMCDLAAILADADAWIPGGRSHRPAPMMAAAAE